MNTNQIISTCILICCSLHLHSQVLINEVLSDNEETISDTDGEFHDYIELYNPGTSAINLTGYSLSDNIENLQKWSFPNIEISSQAFLIIFASKKEGSSEGELHTNFKISSSGETIFLSDNNGALIDQSEETELKKDQAWGRMPDGGNLWTLLPSPSPELSNNDLDKVILSHLGGYYDTNISLSAISPLGNSVRYTTDGSVPTSASPVFNENLLLEDKTSENNVWSEIPTSPTQNLINNKAWQSPGYNVDKAHVLRFASFIGSDISSDISTHTYFVAEDIFEKYDFPVISIITDGANFFDDETGIYVPGDMYDPEDPEWTGNYFQKEAVSERPIHIEYYQKDGDLGFSQDAGARIHGGKTRHAAQKSLRLYARSGYGDKFFRYELLPQKGHDKYKRFVLKTTMGAWGGETVIKDAYAHEVVRDLDFEKQDSRPVVVFINGEYWGIQSIQDRVDEHYISYLTGLSLDSIKLAEPWEHNYDDLKNYLDEHNPLNSSEYEYVQTEIDISSFIDYQIAQMYLKNFDWPANNNQHWRPRFNNGKWRWLLYDLDATFSDYDYNMLEHNTDDDPDHGWPSGPKFTFLFRSLLQNDQFVERFLDRYSVLLNNDFQVTAMTETLTKFIEKYEVEMPSHIARWHFPRDMDGWRTDIAEDIQEFIDNRPCSVKDNIESFFGIDDFNFDCVNPPNSSDPEPTDTSVFIYPNLTVNTINIDFQGKEFINGYLSILDMSGKLLVDQSQIELTPNTKSEISLSKYPTGVYYLSIRYGKNIKTERIVLAK